MREGREATRSLLHTTGAILADWRQSATTADSDAHETVLRAAAEVRAYELVLAMTLIKLTRSSRRLMHSTGRVLNSSYGLSKTRKTLRR